MGTEARTETPRSDEPPSRRGFASRAWGRLPTAVKVALVLAAPVVMWFVIEMPGTEVADLAVPGAVELQLGAGDTVLFKADTDVAFPRRSRRDTPDGCFLTAELRQGGRTVALEQCGLYGTDEVSVARSSRASRDDDGLTRLTVTRQWLGCRLTAPAAGATRVVLTSNLDRCVPRRYGLRAHVRVDRH